MLHVAMTVGLAAGLAWGLLASATGAPFLLAVAEGVRPLGTLFVNAVRMVVIPLVMAVLFEGVTRIGDPRRLGRMGGAYFLFLSAGTVLAIGIGMGLMALALPLVPAIAPPTQEVAAAPAARGLVEFLVALVPPNPVAAAASGDLLALIVFTLMVALAASTLPEARRVRLTELAADVAAALIRLVRWIMWAAPAGIFALIAPVTAQTGLAMLQGLAVFVLTVLAGLALYVAVFYVPAVVFLGPAGLGRHLRASTPATIIAFGTTSGIPALPLMLEAAPDARISATVASTVLPLAVSTHRSGSALFQGAAVVFLAGVYGVAISPAGWLGAVVAVFLASLSVAPVPSASIMALPPALDAVGVPLGGLALLFGIDRVPDMFRSGVNINGHMVAAEVVETLAGEEG